jgi:hypothetical protein
LLIFLCQTIWFLDYTVGYRHKWPANDPAHYKFDCIYRPRANNSKEVSEMQSTRNETKFILYDKLSSTAVEGGAP